MTPASGGIAGLNQARFPATGVGLFLNGATACMTISDTDIRRPGGVDAGVVPVYDFGFEKPGDRKESVKRESQVCGVEISG